MPLSEEEQRLLHQMEQALAEDDPSLASRLRGSKLGARHRRHAVLAAVGFVAGIAVLMVGVITTLTFLGVAGFVLMLASAYAFFAAWRKRDEHSSRSSDRPSTPPQSSDSFMHKMEERWRRRRDSGL